MQHIRFEKHNSFYECILYIDHLVLTPEEVNDSGHGAASILSLKYFVMKKSVDDFVQPVQDGKSESLLSQKPANQKPNSMAQALKKLKNRISVNDLRFLKSIKYEQPVPAHAGTARDLAYSPTEKPW